MTSARIPILAATVLVLATAVLADSKPRRMSENTRFALIRALGAERVYVRRPFPMGLKGLTLRANGKLTPDGEVPLDQDTGSPVNPRGSSLVLLFDGFVPEMTVTRVKELLAPVFDFTSRSSAQAYLDTLPPKVREAIKNHEVLVGMNRELAVMARGRPPRKIREREGTQDYEEWIYGDPPQDVEFVRFVGDEVVRVEIMKITGEKIVRTDREVTLEGILPRREPAVTAEDSEAKNPQQPPTLRRPGEPNPGAGTVYGGKPDPRTIPGSPQPSPPTPPPPPQPQPPQQLLGSPAPAGS